MYEVFVVASPTYTGRFTHPSNSFFLPILLPTSMPNSPKSKNDRLFYDY